MAAKKSSLPLLPLSGRNMFKLKIIFILCYIFIADVSLSQRAIIQKSSPPDLKKNVFAITAGGSPEEFYFCLLGNYERMIVKLPKSFIHSFWFRVGAGPWAEFGPTGMNYVSTLSLLMGRGAVHAEIGSGVLFSYWSDEKEFRPIVNNSHIAGFLGFRYQKPGGSFVLKTGLGWPEGIYLGLGYCF
jgi:hypothetical protein